MSEHETDIGWDAVQIAPGDDVAVALRDLSGAVRVRKGERIDTLELLEAIPFGHKFALADLAAGQEVRKYASSIGQMTQSVRAGQHVHVHNLKSRRATGRR